MCQKHPLAFSNILQIHVDVDSSDSSYCFIPQPRVQLLYFFMHWHLIQKVSKWQICFEFQLYRFCWDWVILVHIQFYCYRQGCTFKAFGSYYVKCPSLSLLRSFNLWQLFLFVDVVCPCFTYATITLETVPLETLNKCPVFVTALSGSQAPLVSFKISHVKMLIVKLTHIVCCQST